MRRVVVCLAAAAMMSAPALAADTLKGRISDSMCNAKHMAGEHDGKKTTDRECTEKCVSGGAKYVFVGEGDKVYKIANQDFAGLGSHQIDFFNREGLSCLPGNSGTCFHTR